MSDEKPPVTDAEKPQSPAVVKSATDTKAKPKAKPALKPATKPVQAAVAAVAAVAPAVDIPPTTPRGNDPVNPKKDFVDDAFSLFGWVD